MAVTILAGGNGTTTTASVASGANLDVILPTTTPATANVMWIFNVTIAGGGSINVAGTADIAPTASAALATSAYYPVGGTGEAIAVTGTSAPFNVVGIPHGTQNNPGRAGKIDSGGSTESIRHLRIMAGPSTAPRIAVNNSRATAMTFIISYTYTGMQFS